MKPFLKKIAMYASLAAAPVFMAGDVVFTAVVLNKESSLSGERTAIVEEYMQSDNFIKAKTQKESEYIALFDEDKISEGKFKQLMKELDTKDFAEAQLLENGTEGEKIRFGNADAKLEDFSRSVGLVAAGLIAGNAVAAMALGASIKTLRKDEKKKAHPEENEL